MHFYVTIFSKIEICKKNFQKKPKKFHVESLKKTKEIVIFKTPKNGSKIAEIAHTCPSRWPNGGGDNFPQGELFKKILGGGKFFWHILGGVNCIFLKGNFIFHKVFR